MPPGTTKGAPLGQRCALRLCSGSVLFEGVLDFLAGLLQITLGLVSLAFSLQAFIARGVTGFLALAADFLGSVLYFVA